MRFYKAEPAMNFKLVELGLMSYFDFNSCLFEESTIQIRQLVNRVCSCTSKKAEPCRGSWHKNMLKLCHLPDTTSGEQPNRAHVCLHSNDGSLEQSYVMLFSAWCSAWISSRKRKTKIGLRNNIKSSLDRLNENLDCVLFLYCSSTAKKAEKL